MEAAKTGSVEAQGALSRWLIDSATDFAMIATDMEGRVTAWSAGAEHALGWTEEEMLGQPVDRIFTPEDRDAERPAVEMRCALEAGSSTDERWHLKRSGRRFWATGRMTPLRNDAGGTVGFVKVLRDRTEQHEASAALVASEERYRSLSDAIDEGFCLIEVRCDDAAKPIDYRFLEVNSAFERHTGLVDAAGSWMRELVPDHEQHWFDTYAKVALTGESTRFVLPAQALNGRWYEVFAYRVGAPADRTVAILFSDVTEQRTAERRLRASEEHLRTLNANLQVSEADLRRADLLRIALADLSDRIRDEREPAAISRIAGEIVGATLGADLVGYGVVDPEAETITVEADWTAPGARSLVGTVRFRDYGVYIDDLKAGRTVVVNDAYADPRTRAFGDALAERSAVAFVNTPVQEQGAFVALLYVSQARARAWSDEELSFIREVSARVRSAAERARSDQALHALNSRLEATVEARTQERDRLWQTTTDLMGSASYDGFLKAVNPAWTGLLGWTEAELLRSPFFDIIDDADHDATAAVVARLSAGETVREFVDHVRAKDGRSHAIMWTAVPDARTGLFNIVGRDITEQRRVEDALRQSQKMEAVGQLTGGLAHDFNNLLTGVTGSLELLQARIAQGRIGEVDRYVNAAQGAAKRAAALTHRLLAFSRRQTLDPRATDVNRLVLGMEDLVRHTVGPAITVERETGESDLWSTLVDPGQLENALLNLCINARDAMPDGGTLKIETANRTLDEEGARRPDLPPGQYVSLCVSDSGTGMTPEVIAKAFDPFFTTKPLGMGTGLGLSMIYGFARQSGGRVLIESEVGRGATVCLYLPRHLGAAEAAETAPELADAPRAEQGQTVLVVDDEPTVRMLVTEVLGDLGYRALEAGEGASGLKVLNSDARIDLLVTDVGLPGGMNGRQLADAARIVRPNLKVLFVTGYADSVVLSHAQLDDGMHLLTKPFSMEALASRIREILQPAVQPIRT